MYGIENMLGTDFFSWYLGDDITDDLTHPLGTLLERLRTIDFDVTRKTLNLSVIYSRVSTWDLPQHLCDMLWVNITRQTGWRLM